MPTATLTEEEKSRVRYHLGIPQTFPVSSIILGFPASAQPAFLVEHALELIPDTAISVIRALIAKCDATDCGIFESQDRLVAKAVDEVDLNPDEAVLRRREYRYWVQKLADNLGVPINAYAAAFQSGGPMPLNISVSN
jgi:phosphoribosylaminoimidazole carboxylase (NCAIR synthetase)